MPFFDLKPYINVVNAIVALIFPERRGGNRLIFDFSKVSPEEFTRFAGFSQNLPKIDVKIDHGEKRGKTKIIACFPYKNPTVRALVWHIKTKRNYHAFACAGFVLAKKIDSENFDDMFDVVNTVGTTETVPILIPMPIHRRRRRERGYNQCELLAWHMQKYCKEKNRRIEIRTDILFRNYHKENAKKQAFKSRDERRAGMSEAFSVNRHAIEKIAGGRRRRIIILDDVLTTGSTMNAAIATLQKAGFKHVSGLALAH